MSSVNQITKVLLENGSHANLYESLDCSLDKIRQKIKEKSTFQTYIYSYPKILSHFSKFASDNYSPSLKEDLLIQGILMTYGWMPRIPRLGLNERANSIDSSNIKTNVEFLSSFNHKSKNGVYSILLDGNSKSRIADLIRFIDNSLTAVSKILHFIRPEDFLIWDSKIQKVLGTRESYKGKNDISKYIQYISEFKILRETCESNNRIMGILEEAKEIFQYKISFARFIELALYVSAADPSRKES